MPIRIALCDDEPQQIMQMRRLLQEWNADKASEIEIRAYNSAEQFLFDYEANPCDLLLLDIEMNGINGMELAKTLRTKGDMLPIVFITGFSEYMADGYDVEALHYLLKPVRKEKLFEVLERFSARGQIRTQVLLPCENGTMRISEDSILYCEAMGKQTHLFLSDGQKLICTCGISKLAKELSHDFIPCHRSYLIHLRFIRSISKTAVTMDNGQELPLSRRLYESVNRAFIVYYREKLS
ncbi:MAG: response regulator transcription factor [Ruminococcus sp.]|nr:response regulator transcription factor [Ruminococcus sp.]